MFSAFRKAATEVTIFHHPSSPSSQKALNMLRSAVSGPYPPTKSTSPPLDFKLEVVEAPPTPDQLKTIMSYVSPNSTLSVFLSAHPSTPSGSEAPQSASAIHNIAANNPNVMKWPIVVDWTKGRVSIGDVAGVQSILETLRKQRDGELPQEEEVDRPKGWFS